MKSGGFAFLDDGELEVLREVGEEAAEVVEVEAGAVDEGPVELVFIGDGDLIADAVDDEGLFILTVDAKAGDGGDEDHPFGVDEAFDFLAVDDVDFFSRPDLEAAGVAIGTEVHHGDALLDHLFCDAIELHFELFHAAHAFGGAFLPHGVHALDGDLVVAKYHFFAERADGGDGGCEDLCGEFRDAFDGRCFNGRGFDGGWGTILSGGGAVQAQSGREKEKMRFHRAIDGPGEVIRQACRNLL